MEAPEKIWINPTLDLPKLNGVIDKDSVQYVRKDTFTEKACEYIFENYHGEKLSLRMINDFKNYLKGE